jgi:DNA polymerase-3 subunit epsilon
MIGAGFIVAHNAGFDRSVLKACCEQAGLATPQMEFRCTMLIIIGDPPALPGWQ